MFEESKLQDIDAWISIVEKERVSRVTYVLNRIAVPWAIGRSTDEWLQALQEERKVVSLKVKQ